MLAVWKVLLSGMTLEWLSEREKGISMDELLVIAMGFQLGLLLDLGLVVGWVPQQGIL